MSKEVADRSERETCIQLRTPATNAQLISQGGHLTVQSVVGVLSRKALFSKEFF